MEFNEKLQQLRTQKNLTQEQLAEHLYVSRTAISKWESGKGYPNIDSLKCISKFFSVTIDELLSSDELIMLAVTENCSNIKRIYDTMSAIIDVLAIIFITLPIYGVPDGDYVYKVSLLGNTNTPNIDLFIHWSIFLTMIAIGFLRLAFIFYKKESWFEFATKVSIAFGAIATCLFAATREPYATILLFLFFSAKVFLWMKQEKTKVNVK